MTPHATILHFAQDGDTSGYFPQLAKWRDRTRFRMLFGTLGPLDPKLGAYMRDQEVRSVDLGCRSRAAYPWAVLRLAWAMRRLRVDVLHTHLFEPSLVGLVAGTLAGVPVRVMTRHYSDYHTRIGKRWHVQIDRLCTRLSTSVIAVSRHTAEHMVAEESAPPEKIRVVLNGVDFDRLRLPPEDPTPRVRQELRAVGAKLILILARLHPEKGHTFLFQALPGLRRRVEGPIVLAVAGAGPFAEAYRREVAALGCEDITRFLGFRTDAASLIKAADVFVLPSLAEAFGLAAVEALHLGTPVVAARSGGLPEIIEHEADGLLVPPGQVQPLEDAVHRVLTDERLRERLRIAGPLKAGRFRFAEMVAGYETIYEQLLAERQR